MGQKCVIQEDGIQDDRRSLDLSLSNEFGDFTSDLGVRESIEIIFRVKKGAGKGEFQDGCQNGRGNLSASLSRFIIELGIRVWRPYWTPS